MSRKSERKNKNKNIFKAVLILACFLAFFVGVFPQKKAKAAITKQISYQGKLTNAAGVAVTDGNYSMKISIYDAATGGSCLWTARGTCGTPTARTVAVANGIFSIMLGDTVAGDNAIALDFNSPYYLGVTVGSDAEMGPSRKPISASGYAFNSDLLDGLDSATSGATSHILATDSGGGITAVGVNSGTGLIQGTGGLTIIGAAVNLNASSNFAVNIATGTSTGTITLGGTGAQTIAIGTGVAAKTITIGNANDDTFSINSSGLDVSTAGALSGITTIGMSGQLTSTLATGTAPFAVTSTTVNTNLNADLLDGYHASAFQTALTNPVTGTGTQNYLAKFTTTGATIGNSVVYDNGTNVGIGTTSPLVKLHIASDSTNTNQPSGIQSTTGDTHTGLYLGSSGNAINEKYGMQFGGWTNYSLGGIFGVATSSAGNSIGDITFDFRAATGDTSLTERMRITSDGNVGIGTTTPGDLLEINGGANNAIIKINNTNNSSLKLGTLSNGYTGLWVNQATPDATNYIVQSDGASRTFLNAQSNGGTSYLAFRIGNATKMTVQENGNVGIGTTSPSYKLDINGNFRSNGLWTTTSAITEWGSGGTAYGGLTWSTGYATVYAVSGNVLNLAANGSTPDVTIDTAGKVGIGTTTPTYNLQVVGTVGISGQLTSTLATGTSPFAVTSTTVNTNLNADLLDGNHASAFQTALTNPVTGTGTANRIAKFTGTSAVGNSGINDLSDALAMTIDASENVGIGTTSPSAQLEINVPSGQTTAGLKITQANSTGYAILQLDRNTIYRNSSVVYSTAGTADWYSGVLYSGSGNSAWSISPDSTFTNSKLVLTTGGNVGIGTTNPGTSLHIYSANVSGIRVERSSAANSNIQYTNTLGTMYAGLSSAANFGIGSSADLASAYLTVLSTGNVGIGTTGPGSRLQIIMPNSETPTLGTLGTGVNFMRADGATGLRIGYYGATGAIFMQNQIIGNTTLAYDLLLQPGGGNVGIGTTSPLAKLDVSINEANSNTVHYLQLNNAAAGYVDWALSKTGSNDMSITNRGTGSGNTPVMTFQYNSGGANIGIGTTSPTANLQIAQGTAGIGTISNSAGGTTVTGVGTQFTNTFKVGDTITANGETHTIATIASNTSMTTDAWTGANAGVAYTLTGGTRFSVLGNGNVGIGTTLPGALLHVGSTNPTIRYTQINNNGQLTVNYNNDGASTPLYIKNLDTTVGISQSVDMQAYFARTGDSTSRISGYLRFGKEQEWTGTDGNTNDSFMSFGVTNNSSVAERMRLTAAGNLGIGTTSPLATLQVGTIVDSIYSLNPSKVNIIGTNLTLSETQMGTLNLTSTSVNAGSNVGLGPTLTFSQNVSQYIAGYEKVIGGIKTYLTTASNVSENSSMGFYTHNGTSLTERVTIDSAGNVGIGTTSPTFNLQVVGTVGASGQITSTLATGTAPFAVTSTTLNTNLNADLLDGQHGSYYLSAASISGTANRIAKFTGTSSLGNSGINDLSDALAMTIDASENVGIGTTSPTSALEVLSSVYPVIRGTRTSSGTNTALAGFDILQKTTSDMVDEFGAMLSFSIEDSAAVKNNIGAIGAIRSGADNKGSLVFRVSNASADPTTEVMRITNSGNVGIGTTGPNAKLDIVGRLRVSDESSGADYGRIFTGNSGGLQAMHFVSGTNIPLAFAVNNGSPSMVLNTNGNVGIGTTNPTLKTHIIGTSGYPATSGTTQTGILRLGNSAGTQVLDIGQNNANGYAWLQSTSNSDLSATWPLLLNPNGGNVGIGTTGPGAKLDVSADGASVRITDTTAVALNVGGYLSLYGNWSTGPTPFEWARIKGGKSSATAGEAGGYLALSTAYGTGGGTLTERMRIDQAGNVGIGTTGPDNKLTVAGNGTTGSGVNDVLRISGGELTTAGDATGLQFVQRDGSDAYGAYIRLVNTASSPSFLNPRLDIGVQNNNTGLLSDMGAKMTILGTGNVGIGTTAPAAKLEVQAASRATAFDAGTGATWHDMIISNPNGTAGSAVGLFLQPNGYHSNAGTGIAAIDAGGDLSADLAFITRPNAAVAKERMRITNTGNLGIGTTSPTYLLHVNGGDIYTSGDMRIAGDDLFMATNTTGYLLVADGTNFNPVAMSGDVTITSAGATAISANAVALSTDTTGNYVATITGGSGISSTGATSGEGIAHALSLGTLTADWSQTGAFDISLANAFSELKIMESAGATYYGIFDVGDLSADQIYSFTTGGTVWTSGNDGSGSTLDADTLDGHDTSYFQTALTNPVTGTGTNGYNAYWTGTNTIGGEQYTAVSRGGTGAGTFTAGGILYGNGASAIGATSVLANGQLLIGDGSGVPTLGTLTDGTAITITEGAGTITIGVTADSITDTQLAYNTGQHLTTTSSPTFASVIAANFRDSTGAYNVNLGSGGSEGRGLVAGYSGGSYGGIGYNVRHTATGGSYIAPLADTSSYLLFTGGSFSFLGAAAGTAGRALTYTAADITAGTYNSQTISSAASFTGTLTAATSLSAPRLISTVATGTAPFAVTSTTVNTNLNADLLDGQHGSYYLSAASISGTANRVAKFTGTSSLGNSGINDLSDALAMTIDASENVGIGTTSPGAKTEIYQAMSDYTTAFTSPHLNLGASNTVDNTGFVGITYDSSTTANYGWSSGSLRSTNGQADFVWKFHNASASGTEWMRITSSGNVGIGTTIPAALFSVGATSQFQVSTAGAVTAVGVNSGTGLIQGTGGLTITGAAINLNASSNFAVNIATGTSTGAVTIGGNANTVAVNSSVWDITTAGVVTGLTGITSSGTITFSGLGTGTDNTVVILNSSNQLTTDEIDSRVWGSTLVDYSTTTANYLAKFSDTNTITNSIVYDNGTNVGIGTTVPNAKLDIYGGALVNRATSGNHYRNVLTTYLGASTQTGTLKIVLPKLSSTMVDITIKGYDYTSIGAWEVRVSGYVYSTGWLATNNKAQIIGNAPFNQIRLGNDGSKPIILLGTTSSNWVYSTVEVSDISTSYSGITDWGTGWSMALVTDETGLTTTATPSPTTYFAGSSSYYINVSGQAVLNTDETINGIDISTGAISDVTTLGMSGRLTSTLATGTSPFAVTSTTVNTNLNADLLDGYHASAFQLALTNPVTGTGTQNYLAKFTTTGSTIGNSLVYDNGTNVGIGTTSPGVALDVIGDVRASVNLRASTTIINTAGLYRGSTAYGYFGLGTATALGATPIVLKSGDSTTYTDGYISLTTSGSERVRVDNVGNVGIGTTTPTYKLHVVGNTYLNGTTTSTGLITGSAGLTITGAAVNLNASSNFAVNIATGTSTGAVTIGGNANTVAVNSSSWDISSVGAGTGFTAFTVDNIYLNGTTIGHTSDTDLLSLASGALTVNGTITATSTISGTRLISTIATGTSPLSVTSTTVNTNLNADLLDGLSSGDFARYYGRVVTDFNSYATSSSGFYGVNGTAANGPEGSYQAMINARNSDVGFQLIGGYTTDDLWYRGWHSSGTFLTWRRLWHDGNDGTGSTLDADLLDGYHASAFQLALTNPVTGTGTQNYLAKFTTTGSTIGNSVIYDNGTSVGIGTTSPTQKLDVNGDVNVNGHDIFMGGADWSIAFSPTYPNYGIFYDDNTSDKIVLSADGGGASDTDFVLAGANVGIGTASPTYKLHTVGTSYLNGTLGVAGVVTLSGVAAGTDNTVLVLNSSNQIVQDEIDSRVWGSTLVDGSGTASYVARWSDANTLTTGVLYDNGTNVGIGTTSTSYKLHVAGTGYFSGLVTAAAGLTANGALTANSTFTLGDGGDTGSINTSVWDISTAGAVTGITTLAASGEITSGGYLNLTNGNLLHNGDFETGTTDGWSGVTSVVTGGYAGNYAAQVTGSVTINSDDYIPIDPVYDVIQLEAFVKKSVAGATPGTLYFGYYAYDANKTLITTAPCGTYCYFAASGYTVPVDSTWHKFSSTRTGEGTANPNFPVGTKFIRILGMVNYGGSSDSVTLIDHITLKKINNGPLFVGNNFSSTNLVDQYQVSQIYTNSSNALNFTTPSNGNYIFNGTGNVGVGTSSPAQRFSVGTATSDYIQSYGGFIGHPTANIGGTGDAAYFPEGIYSAKMNWLYGGIAMNNGGLTAVGAVSGVTTLGMSGRLTSTLATGTSPFAVTSTTVNTNLNADLLDGNHASAFQLALTNPVTGTGTQNYLAKFTTTGSTIGNSVIYDNGTNVGIGTSSPLVKLHITSDSTNTSQPSGIQSTTGDTHTGLYLGSSGSAINEKYGMQFGGWTNYSLGGIFGVATSSSGNSIGDITFDFRAATGDTSLTERMRITSAGNVGIGTTTPTFNLQIAGTLGMSGQLTSTLATGTAPFAVTSTTVNTNLNADLLDGITSDSFLRSDVDDNLTAAIIVPTANRDEGIFGTYDSTKTQHIWSMGTAYRNAADGSTFGNLYGLAYKYGGNAGGHGVYLVNNGTAYSGLGTSIWTAGTLSATGETLTLAAANKLYVNGSTTANTTTAGVLDIDVTSITTNNVGSYLTYNSNAGAAALTQYASRIDMTYGTNASYDNTGYAQYINITQTDAAATAWGLYVNGEDKNYFSGNVGIGTTTSTYKLHVVGNTYLNGTTTSTGLITGSAGLTITGAAVNLNASSNFAVNIATGTSTGTITLGGTGAQTIAIGTGVAAKTITIGNANDDTFSINSSGLDVSTAGALSGITTIGMSGQLTSTLATGTAPFAVTSTTVNTNLNADLLDGYHYNNLPYLGSASGTTNYIAKFTGSNAIGNSLVYDNGTNVSIGTTSAANLLSLQKAGTAKANLNIFSLTNSGNAADMDGTLTSILFNQYYYNATTPAIADSGNITVGTETDWTSTASTQDSFMSFSTALDGTITEYMRITSAGNVGIGTTSPGRTIDVVGNWGGNTIFHQATEGTTYTITTKALGYYFFRPNLGLDTAVTTYNITGLPDTDGTFAFIRATCNVAVYLKVQINGVQISQTAAATHTYTVLRMNGEWHIIGSKGNGSDLAEWMETSGERPMPGELVTIAEKPEQVEKAILSERKNLVGIVATSPHTTMGEATDTSAQVALSGRVPTLVTNINGPIKSGDPITISQIPGYGAKATTSGLAVGKAMEDFDPAINSEKRVACPLGSPENAICGKIIVFVNLDWGEAEMSETDLANITIQANDRGGFKLVQSTGEEIGKMSAFDSLVIGNLRTGEASSNILNVNRICLNNECKDSWGDLTKYLDDQLVFANEKIASIENTEAIRDQKILSLQNELLWLTDVALIQEKSLTSFQSNLINLGIGSNDIRNEISLLSNKLALFKSSAEPEKMELEKLNNETDGAKTTLDKAVYSDAAFGGEYASPGEYREISIDWQETKDLSQYDMKSGNLEFELYLEKANLFEDFNAELGNIQDEQEIQWKKATFPWLVDGWNTVKLSIGSGYEIGQVDWQKISHFRLFFKFKGENNLKIRNVKVEAQKKTNLNPSAIFALNGGSIELNSMESQNTLILALDTKMSEMNSKIGNQQELIDSIQAQVNDINNRNEAYELNVAKIEETANETSLIKRILGLDRAANAGDVDILGKLSAEKTESGQMLIKVSEEAKRTIGESAITEVKIDANDDKIDDETGSDGKKVFVESLMANSKSKVFVTSKKATSQSLAVTSIIEKQGFWVEVENPVKEDLEFDWWMVEEKDVIAP